MKTHYLLVLFCSFGVLLCQQFGGFEIDGNQIDDTNVAAPDWATANNNGNGVLDGWIRANGICYHQDTLKGRANAFLFCDAVRANDDVFMNTKAFTDPLTWKKQSGSVVKKSDISTAMITTTVVNGITWLVLGTTRISTNGDVNYEIEVNKKITFNGNMYVPDRQAGDLLISVDIQPSSNVVSYTFYRCTTTSSVCYNWNSPTATNTSDAAYINFGNVEIYSAFNPKTRFTFGPWKDYDSGYNLVSSFTPSYNFFYELALNMDKFLSSSGPDIPACFNYLMIRSKVSHASASSGMDDFLGPTSVPFCGGIAIVKFYDLNGNGRKEEGEPFSTFNSSTAGLWCFQICGTPCFEVCTDSNDPVTPLSPGQYLVTELFDRGVPSEESYKYIRWYITTAGLNGSNSTQNVFVHLIEETFVEFGNICFENVTFTVGAGNDTFGQYPPRIYWQIVSSVVPGQESNGILYLMYSGNGVWSGTTNATFLPNNNISYVLQVTIDNVNYIDSMTSNSQIIKSTITNTTNRCAATYIDVPLSCISLKITKFIDINADGLNNDLRAGDGWKFFVSTGSKNYPVETTDINGTTGLCLDPGSYNIVENGSSVPTGASSLLWVETTTERQINVNLGYPSGSVEIGNICLESIKFSVEIPPNVPGNFSIETFKAYWNISSPSAAQIKCGCLSGCSCPTSGDVNLTYYDTSNRIWSGYTGNKILPNQEISYFFSIQSGETTYYFGDQNSVGTDAGKVTWYTFQTTSSYPSCNSSATPSRVIPTYNFNATLKKVLNPGEVQKEFGESPVIGFNIKGPFDINLNGFSGVSDPSYIVVWEGDTTTLLLPIGYYEITEFPKTSYVNLTSQFISFTLDSDQESYFEVACLRNITWYLQNIKTEDELFLEYSILPTNILNVPYPSRGLTYTEKIPACSGCTWDFTHHFAIMYNDTVLFTIYEVIGGVNFSLPNVTNVRLQANVSCEDLSLPTLYPLTTIYGKKYLDCNADGVFNEIDEYPGGNFSFTLWNLNNTLVGNATSNQTGYFQFDAVFPGQYKVHEEEKSDYTLTTPNDVILDVPIATPQNVTFGNSPKVILDLQVRSVESNASVKILVYCFGTDEGSLYNKTIEIDSHSLSQLKDLYVGNFNCSFTVQKSC